MELKWSPLASVCVVMASGGYPGNYAKGKIISGLDAANALPHTKVFHAGTALKDGQIVTNGGRVLGVTALGKDLKAAQAAAYAAVEKIHFDGAHFRRDIAAKAFFSFIAALLLLPGKSFLTADDTTFLFFGLLGWLAVGGPLRAEPTNGALARRSFWKATWPICASARVGTKSGGRNPVGATDAGGHEQDCRHGFGSAVCGRR